MRNNFCFILNDSFREKNKGNILKMKKYIILITAILVLLLSGCAKRNTPWQNEDILTLNKQIQVVGDPLDIAFDNENIYVALDQGGISIINNANYSQKWYTMLTSSDESTVTLFKIRKVGVVGEYHRLFLNETDATDRIEIIDNSNLDSLRIIDSITGATQDIQDMKVQKIANPVDDNVIEIIYSAGRNVHYGKYNGNLWLGSTFSIYPPASASGIDFDDSYIYVAAEQRGLLIYDRNSLEMISEIAIPGEAQKVKVVGNYAYLACRQGGFTIVNIADKNEPLLMSNFDTTGYATSIDVKGNYAVVSSGGGGIYLFDVSSPSNPLLKQNITSAGYTNNAKFYNNLLIVAARDEGILIYEMD